MQPIRTSQAQACRASEAGTKTLFLLPLIAVLHPSLSRAADESLPVILRNVAAKYASATDYSMRASTRSSAGSSEFTLAAARPHRCMLRQKSRTNGRFELLLIAGAGEAWGYQPQRKLYTKSGPEQGEEREELARVHHQYFGRFQDLDRLAARASSSGYGTVQTGGRSVRCLRVIVEATRDGGKEELWIDPERYLVLKTVARRQRPLPETGEVVTTSIWHECDLDHPADPSVFAFQPPPGARRTNTLEYR
ncbi:LolA-like protein [Paludibaculum fermentans]|uniref:Outer membrane lipoprotein carrier protein LolA n=1 Tax=Paludibaculum fermentans TaxID=1473598 RepID=A0A7S7NJW1_PALFE|nr:hypothetical protein [Paludibaculum fermentans]QOY84900.1 hypothetical protein IRI77_18735 [Paludibaculum fermentans]